MEKSAFRRLGSGGSVALTAFLALAVTGAGAQVQVSRDQVPAVISGASLTDLIGTPVDELYLYRFDGVAGFEPIPFQVDERILKTFNPGAPDEFTELVYDVAGEDGGLLDADDEVAFLFGDAGEEAPVEAVWPSGAGGMRFALEVTDPLPGGETRHAYLFTGVGLAMTVASHVSWDALATSPVVTDSMTVGFTDNWLVTSYSVAAPCGSGADLIDRVKGRALIQGTFDYEEDEEQWNTVSTYMGGIAGPVRAIRYVRGAMSAVNTIHHDIVSPGLWTRTVNLRVHPIANARLYLDWLPSAGSMFYSSTATMGVPSDGVPDGLPTTWVPWNLTKTPGGGLAMVYEVPLNPLYQTRSALRIDDATLDDAVQTGYPDDDDSAYGDHGLRLTNLLDSSRNRILIRWYAFPLCSNQGSADLAQAYADLVSDPLETNVEVQFFIGPIRGLEVEIAGGDIDLDWTAVPGAVMYRVMRSTDPNLPHDQWTELGTLVGTSYSDVGAAPGAADLFYSVVVVGPSNEEYW